MAKKRGKKSKKKKVSEPVVVERNFVAKHCREFNHATVETDRKKEAKKNGHTSKKHKNRQFKDW